MQNERIPPSINAFFPAAKPVWPACSRDRPALDHIDQIAIVVADISSAIDYFGAAFGWGPFYPATAVGHCSYEGQHGAFELALAFVMVGDIEIELVQPLSGASPYRDQLRDSGEGIFHLRFATDAIESHLQHLHTLSINPIFGWRESQWINVNLDSHRRFGVRSELILTPEKLAAVLEALGRTQSAPAAESTATGAEANAQAAP